MAKKHVLKAEPRQRTGSGVLKQMRREGWVPTVIYGRGTENKNLKIDAKAFDELLAHSTSDNIIINLDLGGVNQLALLQAIQHDSLSGKTLHADFLAIDETTEITAHIPIHLHGEAVGVKAGGIIEQYMHSLEILCLPNDLPDTIDFDVTKLEIGASLHISELILPKGVRPTHAGDVVVAHVGKPAAAVSEAATA